MKIGWNLGSWLKYYSVIKHHWNKIPYTGIVCLKTKQTKKNQKKQHHQFLASLVAITSWQLICFQSRVKSVLGGGCSCKGPVGLLPQIIQWTKQFVVSQGRIVGGHVCSVRACLGEERSDESCHPLIHHNFCLVICPLSVFADPVVIAPPHPPDWPEALAVSCNFPVCRPINLVCSVCVGKMRCSSFHRWNHIRQLKYTSPILFSPPPTHTHTHQVYGCFVHHGNLDMLDPVIDLGAASAVMASA